MATTKNLSPTLLWIVRREIQWGCCGFRQHTVCKQPFDRFKKKVGTVFDQQARFLEVSGCSFTNQFVFVALWEGRLAPEPEWKRCRDSDAVRAAPLALTISATSCRAPPGRASAPAPGEALVRRRRLRQRDGLPSPARARCSSAAAGYRPRSGCSNGPLFFS